jgi:hypothetical protein
LCSFTGGIANLRVAPDIGVPEFRRGCSSRGPAPFISALWARGDGDDLPAAAVRGQALAHRVTMFLMLAWRWAPWRRISDQRLFLALASFT